MHVTPEIRPRRQSSVRCGLAFLACAVGVALCVILGGHLSVAAAANRPAPTLVSSDGINFAATLPRGLFDGAERLVPRQSVSATLWVRNVSDSAESVQVGMQNVTTTSAIFTDGVQVTAADDRTAGVRSLGTLAALDDCTIITSVSNLAAGAEVKSVITLTMADLTGTSGQSQKAELQLQGTAGDMAAGPFVPELCTRGGSLAGTSRPAARSIAYTGAEMSIPLAIAGLAALTTGLILIATRRRVARR